MRRLIVECAKFCKLIMGSGEAIPAELRSWCLAESSVYAERVLCLSPTSHREESAWNKKSPVAERRSGPFCISFRDSRRPEHQQRAEEQRRGEPDDEQIGSA